MEFSPLAPAATPSASATAQQKIIKKAGPDFEEGPYSQMAEDEFYDAVDSALDKHDEDIRLRDMLRAVSVDPTRDTIDEAAIKHHLWPHIDSVSSVNCVLT
jgi:collagen type IV alpha-3-binding protein